MENHQKFSNKGSAMLYRSSLNNYYNVDSFQNNENYRVRGDCYSIYMGKSVLRPKGNHLEEQLKEK